MKGCCCWWHKQYTLFSVILALVHVVCEYMYIHVCIVVFKSNTNLLWQNSSHVYCNLGYSTAQHCKVQTLKGLMLYSTDICTWMYINLKKIGLVNLEVAHDIFWSAHWMSYLHAFKYFVSVSLFCVWHVFCVCVELLDVVRILIGDQRSIVNKFITSVAYVSKLHL